MECKRNTLCLNNVILFFLLLFLFSSASCSDVNNDDLKDIFDKAEESKSDALENSGNIIPGINDVSNLFGDIEKNNDSNQTTPQNEDNTLKSGDEIPLNKILSISVVYNHPSNIKEFAWLYMEENPEVTIKINDYEYDYFRYQQQTLTSLMAGSADDIFESYPINYKDPKIVRYLADFRQFMNSQGEYNTDDRYMNVYDALSYNNKLYAYPISITFYMVAANKTISDSFSDAFSDYESISIFDMLNIAKTFKTDKTYYVMYDTDFSVLFYYVFNSFIDFDKRVCDFNNPKFIDFLDTAKRYTRTDVIYTQLNEPPLYSQELEESAGLLYYFYRLSQHKYLFDYEENTTYANPKPFVNNKKELIITPSVAFSINASSNNKELAWDFIKFMENTADNNAEIFYLNGGYGNYSVVKKWVQNEMPNLIYTYIEDLTFNFEYHIKGDLETQMENAVWQIDKYLNMPMTMVSYGASSWFENAVETLEKYFLDALTAEQTAVEIQNKVTIALME
jgi:multiple sugar transport system substrate-binding protein